MKVVAMRSLKEIVFSQAQDDRLHRMRYFWGMLAQIDSKKLPALADDWVKKNHIDEAFALLFEGTQMREDIREASLKRYIRLCRWLAADGYLDEVHERLQKLVDSEKTALTGLEEQVNFITKYANISPKNIENWLNLSN